jgi:endonuclease YncB( thermonuclease family)
MAPTPSVNALWRAAAWRAVVAGVLLILGGVARAESLLGRVVGVTDGDTVTVLDAANAQHKVRLAGIDAPEKGQPFGERSKENLSRLVFGRDARVDWHKKDRYGRLVGTVWVASPDVSCGRKTDCPKTLDAGMAQLTVGLAWHYKKYAHEQEPQQRGQYAFAEEEARVKRAGLWRDPNPVPPWDWRSAKRSSNGNPPRG